MRKLLPFGGIAALVVATVGISWFLLRGDESVSGVEALYEVGGTAPDSVAAAVDRLDSVNEQEQRAALTPELALRLPEGRLFPEEASLQLVDGSWHEESGFANAIAELRISGEPERRVFLTFGRRGDTWLITSAEVYE